MNQEMLYNNIGIFELLLSEMSFDMDLQDAFDKLVYEVKLCLENGNKVLIAGNGGSAADAQHLAAELMVKQSVVRKAMAAIALTTDSSTMTAVSNDFGHEYVFSRQLEGLAKEGDLFIGFTTSGKSKNMIRAFEYCKVNGIKSFLLGGITGAECGKLATQSLLIPSTKTSLIQQGHQLVYHSLVDALEEKL
jgi:D-sedoheptulose 7-phosphate isomerase